MLTEEQKKYGREYYQKNKEYYKEYYQKNKNRIKEQHRQRYLKTGGSDIKPRDKNYGWIGYGASNEVSRYLEHRERILHRFKNSSSNLKRNYSMPPWKQRLHEMDQVFIDELAQNLLTEKVSLEKIASYAIQKIEEQDKEFEEKIQKAGI